jgi:hypothetical protein
MKGIQIWEDERNTVLKNNKQKPRRNGSRSIIRAIGKISFKKT